jgi:hypothetical protein
MEEFDEDKSVLFFASLIPYAKVHQKRFRGIQIGAPDFFYARCFNNGEERFGGLYIELKSPGGRVSPVQRTVMSSIVKKGEYYVGVCFGYQEALKLVHAYNDVDPITKLNKTSLKELDKLAWSSGCTKEWILADPASSKKGTSKVQTTLEKKVKEKKSGTKRKRSSKEEEKTEKEEPKKKKQKSVEIIEVDDY